MVVWSEFGVGLYMYFSSDIRLYILDLGFSFFFSHFFLAWDRGHIDTSNIWLFDRTLNQSYMPSTTTQDLL